MSAILNCHIQLFIGDLRWHRARSRGRYWWLNLRMRGRFRAKYTERKDNYIFGRTSPYILLCVCVCVCVFVAVTLRPSCDIPLPNFLISNYDDLARRQDGSYMLNGKGLGRKQSWPTWGSILDYSGGIEMGHYENQPRYPLSQLPPLLPARWYTGVLISP